MTISSRAVATAALAVASCAASAAFAQVTSERLVNAAREPQQWLTYSGTYDGCRYTSLDQINRSNVQQLGLQWVFQTRVRGSHETTPLVIDGIMYLTAPQNHAYAVDVAHRPPVVALRADAARRSCRSAAVRRTAASRRSATALFMGTLDAHVVALDTKTGTCAMGRRGRRSRQGLQLHRRAARRQRQGHRRRRRRRVRRCAGSSTPTMRRPGKRAWRFYTIPGRGRDRQRHLDRATRGSAAARRPGSPAVRSGAEHAVLGHRQPRTRRCTAPIAPATTSTPIRCVALDPDTGTLKWHFQFTPHDVHDWDSTHTPILFDDTIAGPAAQARRRREPQRILLRARSRHRRVPARTGRTPRSRGRRNWTRNGRPIVLPNTDPTAEGQPRLSERHRRDQLALAVLQSADASRVLLQQRAVRHVHGGREARAAASSGAAVHRQRVLRAARRARRGRGARGRSENGRDPLGVP